jgi:Ni2+-binding GTPase involved in maturation of urease and hydrogenase
MAIANAVPGAPGSGFTLLFEALVLSFAAAMPMAKVSAMTREHDTRIWQVVEHHVNAVQGAKSPSHVLAWTFISDVDQP